MEGIPDLSDPSVSAVECINKTLIQKRTGILSILFVGDAKLKHQQTRKRRNKMIHKELITYLQLLIIMTTCFVAHGQAPRVVKAYVIPAFPSTADSISIIDSAWVGDSGNYRNSYTILKKNDSIIITNCFWLEPGWTIVTFKNDTTSIAPLPQGLYHCFIYSRMHNIDIDSSLDCSQIPINDTFRFTFTVSQYRVGIPNLTLTTLTLSPNPAITTLYSSTSLHELDLSITDITGRICPAPHTDRDIDISALPAGVYCLRLQTREGSSVVRRFVRE